MGEGFGKVTRMSAIVAVVLAVMMLGGPVLQLGGKTVDISPVNSVQAANGNRVFTVGQIDYAGGMATMNPFIYTQSEEFQTIWPCYSTLLMYDENNAIIGDLATSWTVSPDGMTWDFQLAHNAYFVDPMHPGVKDPARLVTAQDVIWTFWEINNDTGNHLSAYFLNGKVGIIQSLRQGADQWEVILTTKQPYAPLLGALAGIPIVPEYIWNHLPGGKTPLTYGNIPLVGSGYFYFNQTAIPSTVGILKRNPIWFQEENRGWQIHVDTLQYRTELSVVTAWTELTSSPPIIDVYSGITPSQYKGSLVNQTTRYVMGFAQATGFVWEYQLNQMTDANRVLWQKLGMVRNGGSNNQLLLNPTIKLALAMSVNKQEFIDKAYGGFGSVADSAVPNVNRWHYTYPTPIVFNPVAARKLLNDAGWNYSSTGGYATDTTCPLYRKGPVNNTLYQPLSFRLLSLAPEAYWDTGSRLIVEWARQAGIEYTRTLMSTNQANGAWYKADYDAWLWDWMFTPLSDPSTDVLSVNTQSAIGTWSGSYWSNATFNKMYNDSLLAVDEGARRIITDEMQAMLYEDHAEQLVAYRKELYAANFETWNKTSYGNWETHYQLMPDQATPYLYMQLYPNNNHAPTITGLSPTIGTYEVNTVHNYVAGADDASGLKYQWYYGDGTVSGWQVPSYAFTHSYTNDGVYTLYFAAQEQGSPDGYISWGRTSVTIVNPANKAPSGPGIQRLPAGGVNSGTIVTFTGNATDTDPLYFTWSFGDGIGAVGDVATHQFKTPGDYTVYMNVTDNHPGGGRPAQTTAGIHVTPNGQPQVSLPSSRLVQMKQLYTYTATATDPDSDPLRYTWTWGDGSTDVTTVPTADHNYAQKNPGFNLMLYTDDGTGLTGHNVTQNEVVTVVGNPTMPTITTWTVNNVTTPVTARAGTNLWFTGAAKDQGGDTETLTFEFKLGDLVWNNFTEVMPGINKVVTFSFAHGYLAAGTYTAYLYVYDGQNITQSAGIIITITTNHPPWIQIKPTNKLGNVGVAVLMSVTAVDNDSGTVLRYTWDFGDGTGVSILGIAGASQSHIYTSSGNRTYTVYVDDQSGIPGHNLTSSAKASIAFNLPLLVGWNFVAVPLVGGGYKASTLGLATGEMISQWAPATQKYDKTYIKGVSPPIMDFTLAPNVGYWIWAKTARSISLYGTVPTTTQTLSITIPSAGGWVTIGFESLKTNLKANNVTAMYGGTGVITMVAYFNAATGKYSSWVSVVPNLNNFALGPGVGYWIWINHGTGGTLSYIP